MVSSKICGVISSDDYSILLGIRDRLTGGRRGHGCYNSWRAVFLPQPLEDGASIVSGLHCLYTANAGSNIFCIDRITWLTLCVAMLSIQVF